MSKSATGSSRVAIAVFAVGAAVLLGFPGEAPAIQLIQPDSVRLATSQAVPGEIIVRYRGASTRAARTNVLNSVGGKLKSPLLLERTDLVTVPVGREAAAIAALRRNPAVESAEVNGIVHADAVTNDPSLGQLWGINNTGQVVNGATGTADADIDGFEAWRLVKGVTTPVLVAIIDTGISMNHPDLAARIYTNPGEIPGNHIDDDSNGFVDDVHGWDFINNDNDPTDDNNHGTHVSGTIAGMTNNGLGVAGVASFPTLTGAGVWPGPKLLPVKVLAANGSGSFAAIINGIVYAGLMHAKVANMSLGGTGTNASVDAAIGAAPNTFFLVAAGNDGANNDVSPHTPCVPASLPDQPNKICVAATDSQDLLASFSNYSSTQVDLGAPGVSVLSTIAQTTLLSDNFETPISGRYATNDAGQSGTNFWERSTGFATSGSRSLTDSPAGQYAINSNTWARLINTVNETGGSSCTVEAEVKWDYLTGDSFDVDVSPNGTAWANALFSGPRNVTGHMTVNLGSTYSGLATLYIRLRFASDSSGTADGVYFDDLAVRCFKSTQNATSYAFFQGTSMATPHVAGAAALLFAKFPGASVAAIRNRIMSTVDHDAALVGKTVTGGRLNVYKAGADSAASVSGGVLRFTAGAGEMNNVVVTKFIDAGVPKFKVADPYSTSTTLPQSGSRALPGPGCAAFNAYAVKCPAAGISSIVINTGDLDDVINAATIAIPVTIDAGDGNDTLIGGTAGDTLIGGPGQDRFTGGTGNDTIRAFDNVADLSFSCGENAGDHDIVDADATPNDPIIASPGNCEAVTKH